MSCGWWFLAGGHPTSSWTCPVTGTHFFLMLPLHWELRTALLILPWNLPPFHFYPLLFLPMKTHFKTQTPCHLLSLPCKLLYLQWFLFFFKLKKDFDCTVFIMAQGLFLVACFSCGGGSRVCGLSSSCLRASLVATCGFNCSVACEILVFQPGIEPVFPGR